MLRSLFLSNGVFGLEFDYIWEEDTGEIITMELICIKEGSATLLAMFWKFGIRIPDLFSPTILIFWSLSIGIWDVSKVAFLTGLTRGVCKGDGI